jgi:hypothetical protein
MRPKNQPRARRPPLAAAVITSVAIGVLAGCAGSSKTVNGHASTTAAGRAVDATFAKRAAVVCLQGRQLNLGGPPPYPNFHPLHPTVSEMPAMGSWIQTGISPARHALRLVERLGQPSSGRAAWGGFVTAADRFVNELQTQAAAAQHTQVKAFITSAHVIAADQTAYLSAAAKTGVPQCADIFGPSGPPPPRS